MANFTWIIDLLDEPEKKLTWQKPTKLKQVKYPDCLCQWCHDRAKLDGHDVCIECLGTDACFNCYPNGGMFWVPSIYLN